MTTGRLAVAAEWIRRWAEWGGVALTRWQVEVLALNFGGDTWEAVARHAWREQRRDPTRLRRRALRHMYRVRRKGKW